MDKGIVKPIGCPAESAHDKQGKYLADIPASSWRHEAELLVATCGGNSVLHVDAGTGSLVAELLKLGVDAYGVAIADEAIKCANRHAPGRFVRALSSKLPFPDGSFECLVATDCLDLNAPHEIRAIIRELHRVCGRYLLVQIRVGQAQGEIGVTADDRYKWLASEFFEAGFRKHPGSYGLGAFEALESSFVSHGLLLEKLPPNAGTPLDGDYDRQTGATADANLYKYEWAASYVRPGDFVFDTAPGTGAGAYLLAYRSEAARVYCNVEETLHVRFDDTYIGSEARLHVAGVDAITEAAPCDLVVCLDGSVQRAGVAGIASSFANRITPGGRLLISVTLEGPGERSDWRAIIAGTVPSGWYLEQVFCLQGGRRIEGDMPARSFSQCDLVSGAPLGPGSDLLLVLMRDPVGTKLPYRESVYGASDKPADVLEFARDYRNPWLLRAMVEFPFRARNSKVLAAMADAVLADRANSYLPDAAAALAIKGYQLLERDPVLAEEVDALLGNIREFLDHADRETHRQRSSRVQRWLASRRSGHVNGSAHLQRWKISLAYLQASLLRKIGRFDAALHALDLVLSMDWRSFSPTIGTKIVDAAYEAGQLLASQGRIDEARGRWKKGVIIAFDLLHCGVSSFVGDMNDPQQFPTIVAVEFLDSATRCIKALHWSAKPRVLPRSRLFEHSRQCWKWMIKERSLAIIDTEARVRSRDAVIVDQSRKLTERWDVLQKLDAMVKERDRAMAAQAELLEERWDVMRQQDAMVRDRDETIAAQAKLLDERWDVMQCQDEIIRDRDEAIAVKAKLIGEHEAVMSQMEADIRERDEVIANLREQFVQSKASHE